MKLAEKEPVTLVKIENILFASDFSNASLGALPHVAALARRYSSKVYLAHIVMPDAYPLLLPESALEQLEGDARQRLADVSHARRLEGIPNETVVVRGALIPALLEMVNRYQIDLVVAGTHGHSGFKRFLLGSVAEEIFRHAPCPVLTVPPHAYRAQGTREAGFRHILIPTDLSEKSADVVRYAVSLAAEYSARLTVLHVSQDPIAAAPLLVRDLSERMQKLVPAEAEPWCNAEYRVEHGEPAETILNVAREEMADLIALDVREAPAYATHLEGNVAYQVVAEAACPVLTFRANSTHRDVTDWS